MRRFTRLSCRYLGEGIYIKKDNEKYKSFLSSAIPEPQKEAKKRGNVGGEDKISELEKSVKDINDQLAKKNRDDLDAMYNIDTDNLSTSLNRLLKSYEDGITSAKADIQTWANSQQSGFEAIATWQNSTTQSIADIKGTADENAAQITLLTQWKSSASQTISSIQQETSANTASITALTNWKSTADSDIDELIETTALIRATADSNEASIEQIVTAVGADGKVNAASIVAAVNNSGSSVKISADKVDISGFVTFTDLTTAGKAEISGNNITLLADEYCGAESQIDFAKLDSDVYSTLGSIYTLDNGSSSDDLARFALMLRTNNVYVNGTRYRAALKLQSRGSMSLESDYGMIYMYAPDDVYVEPRGVFRVYSNLSSANCSLNSKEYTFCSDGIYYGSKLLLST